MATEKKSIGVTVIGSAVDLANALDEWKNAGADSLTVVRAIQDFIVAHIDARDERESS